MENEFTAYFEWLFVKCRVTVLSVNGMCNQLQMPYIEKLLAHAEALPGDYEYAKRVLAEKFRPDGTVCIALLVVTPEGEAKAYFVKRAKLIDIIARSILSDDAEWLAWRGTVVDTNRVPEFVTNMLYQLPAEYVMSRFPALDHNIWGFNSMQSARALPKEADVSVHKEAARSFDLARFANINVYTRDGRYWDAVTDVQRPALKPYDVDFHCTKGTRAAKCQCVPPCPDPAAVALAYRSVCAIETCALELDEDAEAVVLRETGLSYRRFLRYAMFHQIIQYYADDGHAQENLLPAPTDMGEALDRLVQWGGFMRPLLTAILPATGVFTTITRMRRVDADTAYGVVKNIASEVYDFVPKACSEMISLARNKTGAGTGEVAFLEYYDVVCIPYDVLACDLDLTFDSDPEQRLRWFIGKSQGTPLMITDDMVRDRPGAAYAQLDDGVVLCLPKAVTADARGAAVFAVVTSPPPAHEGVRLPVFLSLCRDFMHGSAREVFWVVRTMLYFVGGRDFAMECVREFTDEEMLYLRTTIPVIIDAALNREAAIPSGDQDPEGGELPRQLNIFVGLVHLFVALVFYDEECVIDMAAEIAAIHRNAGDVLGGRAEYAGLAEVLAAKSGSGLGYAPLVGLFIADMYKGGKITANEAQAFLLGFRLVCTDDTLGYPLRATLASEGHLRHPSACKWVGEVTGSSTPEARVMFDLFRFVDATDITIKAESTADRQMTYASELRDADLSGLSFPIFFRHTEEHAILDSDALPVTRCRGVTDPITDLDVIRDRCTRRTDRGTTVQPSPFCGADPAVVSHILQHGLYARGHKRFIHDKVFSLDDDDQAPSGSQQRQLDAPELDFIQQGTTAAPQ